MKIHLGCGKVFIPGYVHIDAVDYPHIDHITSIDYLPFIADKSVEVIYACHVLEHFKRRDVHRVLTEWYRILSPGGVLRISVPDFSKLCELYLTHKKMEMILGPLFGRGDYLYNIHYNAFDFESLKIVLEKACFTDVRLYNWRETEHSDVDDYSQAYIPHMDKESGTLISLNIECTKIK